MMSKLWKELKVGNMILPHRLAMAPMTRSRALADGVPGELAAEYYGQRAGLGLIISEGTQPSDDGQGYINSPGIYSEAHIDGWKKITSHVHEEGGHIFIQLMHVGRISHPDNTSHHRQPVAPSAISPEVKLFTVEGMKEIPTPRALNTDEINEVIQEFRTAAAAAIKAGADGVEIHGANGYLIQQFLSENSNQRNDEYGGTIENRARFAIEVTKAVVDEIGADKTGFRISPSSTLHDIEEGEFGPDVYRFLVAELDKLDLAYLHVMHVGNELLLKEVRQIWSNPLLVNRAGRPLEQLTTDLDNDLADMVPVGGWALANPDFVERIKNNAPLNEADRNTFYGGGAEGYTDYPFLNK